MSVFPCFATISNSFEETFGLTSILVRRFRPRPFAAMAALLLCVGLTHGGARASTLTTLYTFTGGLDGSAPTTGLVVGPGEALYGANGKVVYEFTQNPDLSWSVTPIYTAAVTSLVGAPHVLYGISGQAVVALTPPASGETLWTSTSLHVFAGGKDGSNPHGIAVAANGSIVGTTVSGGGASNACGSYNDEPTGCGTLLTLKEKDGVWVEKILHAFKGGNDGAFPFAAPSFDPKGNIYFSTEQGGGNAAAGKSPSSCEGNGKMGYYESDVPLAFVIWEEACEAGGPAFSDSVLFDIAKSVSSTPDTQTAAGAAETPAPAKAAKAVIATWTGGGIASDCPALENNGCGVVGLLTRRADGSKSWKLKVLHNFTQADGGAPSGYLTAAGKDTIYGVTGVYGDACTSLGYRIGGCGTIYKLQNTANGWAWGGVAYLFPGGANGSIPLPQLLLHDGTLFGATKFGGAGCAGIGCGTLFSLTP